jgi:hypothetical protein
MMPTRLPERFSISNRERFRKRMDRLADGRLHFYQAMLDADSSSERYLTLAGTARDKPAGRKDGPFSAEQEFRYALKRGWICGTE